MKKLLISVSFILFIYNSFSQQTIELTNWKFKTGDNPEWSKPGFNDADWKSLNVGSSWQLQGYDGYHGYAWYRVTFNLPSELKKNPRSNGIQFLLGRIEDCDQTFLNGKLIGQNAKIIDQHDAASLEDLSKTPLSASLVRNYTIPQNDSRLLWDQPNVLSIRVYEAGGNEEGKWTYDTVGKGGMCSLPVNIQTVAPSLKNLLSIDTRSTELERKPDGTKSKTSILKSNASFEVEGKLTTEITDEETGKVITTESRDIVLKKGETPITVSFKGRPAQKLKAIYTFTESTTGEKLIETWSNVPKVDFSYAFGTPHRITVGRPTNNNRTLLDLRQGKLNMLWNYKDLTDLVLGTEMIPADNSRTWEVEIVPQIDGTAFKDSRWTRLDSYVPSLDNSYRDNKGNFRVEVIGGFTGTVARVEVENTDNQPHQYRLMCKENNGAQWKGINRAWMDPGRFPADALFAGVFDRYDRVLIFGIGADQWVDSPDGRPINAKTISFIWDLKPGEKRTAWLVRPYEAYGTDLPALRLHDWQQEFDAGKKEWRELAKQTEKVLVPDADVMNAFKACFSDLYIMREPAKGGIIVPTAGTQIYRGSGATIECIADMLAIDQMGLHSDALEQSKYFLFNHGNDGDWCEPLGWQAEMWSITGFKAWVALEHYQLTGDRDYLEKIYPYMLVSSRFQESQRARTRVLQNGERSLNYGLMPRGVGDCGLPDGDWFGIFIPHNIWSVYADSVTLSAARVLGKKDDAKELEKIFRTAKTDLLYTIDKGAIDEGTFRWIPAQAGKTTGSRFAVLNILFPCHILCPNDELVTGTLKYMEKRISLGGLPLHTGFMENGSWMAMTLDQIAEAYLSRGNGDKAAHYLYTSLNHCTPLITSCEERGQEANTNEVGGDLQHLYTPLAVVRIIRDMLVMEDGDGLNLALGTDRSWLASGKPIGVTDMPTHFGNVTYQMQYDPKKNTVSGEIKLSPKPNQEACKWTTMHIRLPKGMKVTSVDKASKATVLPNGEGIKWHGQITEVKFRAQISN